MSERGASSRDYTFRPRRDSYNRTSTDSTAIRSSLHHLERYGLVTRRQRSPPIGCTNYRTRLIHGHGFLSRVPRRNQESAAGLLGPSRSGIVDRLRDPRYYQIAVLGVLLTYGILTLGFRVGPAEISVLIIAALTTQAVCGRIFSVPFDPKSPLISARPTRKSRFSIPKRIYSRCRPHSSMQ